MFCRSIPAWIGVDFRGSGGVREIVGSSSRGRRRRPILASMKTSLTTRNVGLLLAVPVIGGCLLACAQRLEPFERAAAHAGIDAVERYDNRPPPDIRDPALNPSAKLAFRVAVPPDDPVAAEARALAGEPAASDDPFVWFPVAEQATWRDVGRTVAFPEVNPVPRDDNRLGLVTAQDGHAMYVLLHNTLSRTFSPDTFPGFAVASAEVTYDVRSRPSVNFFFAENTAPAFTDWTAGQAGERIAAIVDGWVVVTPRVDGPMSGSGMLTGVFPLTDAEDLSRRLLTSEPITPDGLE
jgi:hypothetical protein